MLVWDFKSTDPKISKETQIRDSYFPRQINNQVFLKIKKIECNNIKENINMIG